MTKTLTNSAATHCLLVVDEQEANIHVLRRMLSKVGFEIIPATNAADALQKLASRLPDLILLDLRLPSLKGLELCRRIQENPAWAEIPIIFLSETKDKDL